MKTKTFLILRVVQVPTGVNQNALQKWIALLKTLDFVFLAARFFCLLFFGSEIPFSTGGQQFSRTSDCAVLSSCFSVSSASRSLGALLSVLVLDLLELLVSTSENNLPAKLFFLGLLIVISRSSVLRLVDGSFLEASSLLALVALLGALLILVLTNENNLPAMLFLLEDPSL